MTPCTAMPCGSTIAMIASGVGTGVVTIAIHAGGAMSIHPDRGKTAGSKAEYD